ncbi:radical SAM protein [Streptomyces goshikiensis]|uniref:radical SAM protein n=1 Tax=Streptomyces goshikiensis TaxID=1942 RepID=UPI00382C546F
MTIARKAPARLRSLSLEITGRCQLTCPSLCYAASGPTRGHGTMGDDDWVRTIDQSVALGAEEVQLIGGEPTLHPGFVSIARHAVDSGLRVRVYSNLFRISEDHWQLLEHQAVRLATTYHSSIAAEHDEVTGRQGSHTATRANITQAVRRGIALKVAVLDACDHQRAERARTELEALGVRDIHVGRVRAVGNAAAGTALPSTAELCGRCGDQRAVVLPNGDVAVCEIGRFLTAGNVQSASLASVLSSPQWAAASASIPRRTGPTACHPDCQPSNSDSCDPGKNDPCDPMGYAPPAPGSPVAAVPALV